MRHVREGTWNRYASEIVRGAERSELRRSSPSPPRWWCHRHMPATRGPGLLDFDHDDRIDPVDELRALLAKPPEPFHEPARPGLMNHGRALEAVTLAYEGVDHVDLDERPSTDVRHRLRRADLSEEEVIVVPDASFPSATGSATRPRTRSRRNRVLVRGRDASCPRSESPRLPSRCSLTKR